MNSFNFSAQADAVDPQAELDRWIETGLSLEGDIDRAKQIGLNLIKNKPWNEGVDFFAPPGKVLCKF